jgi:predicted nuclease of predicted toxin-antitoxin system
VKFLVDNQLPPALSRYLTKRGFDSEHVLDIGLAGALDSQICRYAEVQNRIIVSKDEDFLYLAARPSAKIRFIWVQLGNCRTSSLLEAFERHWHSIESALKKGEQIIEIR